MNYYMFDVLLSMLNIMIPMMLMIFVMLFYMRYVRRIKEKESIKRKKYTANFCFDDKTNYEEYIYLAETNGFKYNLDNSETEILSILTTFDKISVALKNDVLDEKIIIEYYGKYFIHFYSIFRYLILKRRESSKNPELFIEYEKLVRKWFESTDYPGGSGDER